LQRRRIFLWCGDKVVTEMNESVAEPLEKQIRADLSVAKDQRVDELAKKLGIPILKPNKADLEKVRRILARGEPLSRIVREQREATTI
jgi:hypothetical protein